MVCAIACLLAVLACSIAYEGINFSDDPEDIDRQNMAYEMTEMAKDYQPADLPASGAGADTAETTMPTTAPAVSSGEMPAITRTDVHTYSVEATNNGCICAVDGDVEVTFIFAGDTLEVLDSQGVPTTYTKSGENTYTRSFMGYYILVNEAGDSTEVEEEKRVVIIFTDAGYVMEHYSGEDTSPCCVHTFTKK